MKQILFVLLVASLMFSCTELSEKTAKDSYEKSKETLAERESKYPQKFLTVAAHDRKNIIGQTVIKGTINNKASVCTYKDIVLKLSFYSKTKVLLEEGGETIYEEIGPNNSQKFKTKYFAPKGTDSVAITVTGATVVKPTN